MILFQVRDYLKSGGATPLRDLAGHFQIPEEAARQLIEHWERKGKVRKLPAGTLCQGGCRSCSPDSVELYEWTEADG